MITIRPLNGSINNGDDCGYGCGCDYSYHNASFSAPNFSVSMAEETYNGTEYESNNIWHKGRSSYYYYYGDGYLYSGSAPGSHIPGGSAPGKPGSYGMVAFAAMPLNYNANPNFSKFALVDPKAILDKNCPKPPEPKIPDPVTPSVEDACFIAGTLVYSDFDSQITIESIRVGDFVLAIPANDTQKKPRRCRVLQVFHNPPSPTWHVVFQRKGNLLLELQVTGEHRFYVRGRGWIALEEMNLGDIGVSLQGQPMVLLSKTFNPTPVPVYNLEVEGYHTYFVGDGNSSILVHNDYDYKNNFLKNASDDLKKLLSENEVQYHHLKPQRLKDFISKDELHGASNIRAVPNGIHSQITALQKAWFNEKIRKMVEEGLTPVDARKKVEELVVLGEIDDLNAVIEKQYGKYMIDASDSVKDAAKKIKEAENLTQNIEKVKGVMQKARKALNLKTLSGALAFFSAFEAYAIARGATHPSPETQAALQGLLDTYRNLLDQGLQQGYLGRGDMDALLLNTDQYLEAIGVNERDRRIILQPVQTTIDLRGY